MLGRRQVTETKVGPYIWLTYQEVHDAALRMGSAIRSRGVNSVVFCCFGYSSLVGVFGPAKQGGFEFSWEEFLPDKYCYSPSQSILCFRECLMVGFEHEDKGDFATSLKHFRDAWVKPMTLCIARLDKMLTVYKRVKKRLTVLINCTVKQRKQGYDSNVESQKLLEKNFLPQFPKDVIADSGQVLPTTKTLDSDPCESV
ncbi:unnamed protein product [Prunus armeniaca]|uniref:Uncharacterized protein n=1 Tax=Prunus armeniaca TaxID=36596 RepID=A0A6J5YAQ6_PRUAR|nr:unnamed protein product [Prunus armeniaca]